LGYVVIAVCEGLKDKEGRTLVESKVKTDIDTFGHAQRGGIADFLCNLIKDKLGIKARFDKPGTIQRVSMMCASEVDLEEGYEAGKAAVEQSVQGKSGYMITLERASSEEYKCIIGLIMLEHVANLKRLVPEEFINEDGNDVTQEFLEWARPLIRPGLPRYARLKRVLVKKKLE